MSRLAPIALFTYNRPEHTRRTVTALKANRLAPESRLFVFSDGEKGEKDLPAVEAVREYVWSIDGFASVKVFAHEHNHGLANSLIAGTTRIVNEFGRVIVLEDDIYTSPYFLDYMNDALELYKDDERVCNIDAFLALLEYKNMPQSFFMPLVEIWGWGTWLRAWKDFEPDSRKLLSQIEALGLEHKFNMDGAYPYMDMLRAQIEGRIDSWAVRWYAGNLIRGRLSLSPGRTFALNIGIDGSGTHFTRKASSNRFNGQLADSYTPLKRIPVEVNHDVWEAVKLARKKAVSPASPMHRILRKIYQTLRRWYA